MAQGKDFYNVLGVSKDASQESISAAFKKLAMEHHPVGLARSCILLIFRTQSPSACPPPPPDLEQDKNLDDPSAKERFQDLLEAKETLLDPRKRER